MFDDRVKWLKTQKSFGQSASEQIHAKIKVSLCPKSQKKKGNKIHIHADRGKWGISFDNIIYTIPKKKKNPIRVRYIQKQVKKVTCVL